MRSPVTVAVAATAVQASAWLPLDTNQRPFNVQLDASPDAASTGTAAVEYTPDNPNDFKNAVQRAGLAISRSGTVATVLSNLPHALSAGDSIVVVGSGDANLDGTYSVASVPTANSLTYTVANTGALKGTGNEQVAFLRVYPVANMTALTARGDGSLGFPVRAVRIAITAAGVGTWRLSASQGYGRG